MEVFLVSYNPKTPRAVITVYFVNENLNQKQVSLRDL